MPLFACFFRTMTGPGTLRDAGRKDDSALILLYLIGFVAGIVAGISPCILPVLPIILVAGVAPPLGRDGVHHRHDPARPRPGGGRRATDGRRTGRRHRRRGPRRPRHAATATGPTP